MDAPALADFVFAAYAVAGAIIGLFVLATLWRRLRARRILARLKDEAA
ncbi:MAG: hypothetical protein ACK5WQ_01315 [Alphaproteobacteria bacterium]|jgi:hypothetical protein|nr:hypothetical protein [Rickettsiales bacterium]